MREPAPVKVTVCAPETGEGHLELERRMAAFRARYILETIGALSCPGPQKRELLQTVMEAIRAQAEKKE